MDSNIKTIAEKIWEALDKFGKWIVIVCIAIILVTQYKHCETLSNIKEQTQLDSRKLLQNLAALHDSLRVELKKDSGLNYTKPVFIVPNGKDLKELDDKLYKEFQTQSGKLYTLEKMIIELNSQIQGMKGKTEITHSDSLQWKFSWVFDTTFKNSGRRYLSGYTQTKFDYKNGKLVLQSAESKILEDLINLTLTTGIKLENGNYKIFVTSDTPGFKITDLKGAIIPSSDPIFQKPTKTKKFAISLTVGPVMGYGTSIGTSGLQSGIFGGIGCMFGISYNIISF